MIDPDTIFEAFRKTVRKLTHQYKRELKRSNM